MCDMMLSLGFTAPISREFCMKMGLWTLMTEKILCSGYLGNGCYGNGKTFCEPICLRNVDSGGQEWMEKEYVLSWKLIFCHGNQCYHNNQKISSR